MRIVIWVVSFLLSISLLIIIILIYQYSYNDISFQILSFYHQSSKISKFQNVFSPGRFIEIKFFILAIFCLSIAWLVFYFKNEKKINLRLKLISNLFINAFKDFFRPLTNAGKYEKILLALLFVTLVINGIYFLPNLPFHIDERFTYLYFVNKGLFVSLAYYPNPNNHIFYTLICNFSNLFFSNPKWVMKIPVFIISLVSPIIFFLFLRRSFNFFLSFIAILIFSFNSYEMYYSYNGRGYILMNLLLIISTGCLYKLASISDKNKILVLRTIFIISSFLGFYTIPIFIFPFLGMIAWFLFISIINKNFKKLTNVIIDISIITLINFLFYLPVFIFNGFGAVTNNSWVKSRDFLQYFKIFPEMLNSISGVLFYDNPFSIYFIAGEVFLIIFLLIYVKNRETLLWLSLIFTVFLILIPIIMFLRITIYQRVFGYLWVIQSVFLAVLCNSIYLYIKEKISILISKTFFLLLVFIFIIFNLNLINQIAFPIYFNWYNSADRVANFLYKENAQGIFFNTYEMSLCTRFQYETNDRQIFCSSHGNAPLKQNNFIVIEQPGIIYNLTGYKLVYSDPITKIYKLDK